ncbi:MAG: ABC transporter substrate-binding protein [Muricomes sp.]
MKRKTMLKRVIAMMLILCLLFVTGCSSQKTENNSAETKTTDTTAKSDDKEASTGTRTVTNVDGTTVEIPENVTGVAPTIGAFAHITAMLGGSDRIVASTQGLDPLFFTVWPKTNPDKHDTSNMEDIIASGAQVTYGPNFTDEQRAQLEAAGISVLQINAFSNAEELKAIVTLIGDILGGDAPERAKAFNTYYDGNIEYVKNMTKDLTDDQKVRVLNLRYSSDSYTTVSGTDISAFYAESAGGNFVSEEYEATDANMTVSAEQIIEWAPDVIFTMGRAAHDQIVNDPALASVPAVANGKVFTEPSGTYPWSVRSAEGALMPLFLAKIMYPDIFKDLSVEDKTKEFYKDMYDYNLSDEEVKTIMAGRE